MTERRDADQRRTDPRRTDAARDPVDREPITEAILDLQRSAGNRAVREILSAEEPGGSPAVRLRDAVRASRTAAGPEFGFDVQRDLKGSGPTAKLPGGGGRTLRFGSRGADVAALQAALGVGADGIFGSQTFAAVVAFQRSAGLAADGIVGPQTRAALSGAAIGGATKGGAVGAGIGGEAGGGGAGAKVGGGPGGGSKVAGGGAGPAEFGFDGEPSKLGAEGSTTKVAEPIEDETGLSKLG
jgi:peptidoglycan hydrolase-like protein with peptidoglycan-binding domain